MNKKEIFVISLGGSLIVPEEIDIGFIKEFKKMIEKQIRKGQRFILVTGGGIVARKYQIAAKEFSKGDNYELDMIGISATKINAHLIRSVFSKHSHMEIIENPNRKIAFEENVVVASGWKPGSSSDYVAVLLAKKLGAKKVINLSNIDYVYDCDPKIFKHAKIIEEISWKEMLKILPKKWSPGLNAPFDPVASSLASKESIEVVIMNGKKVKNIENYLNGKSFNGTKITA